MELSFDIVTLALIWFVVFLFSTTCHEGAHALVAKLGGDPTASGQITLNPIPHIQREPFGMVVVPFVTLLLNSGGAMIGWASAPYDLVWAYRHPHRAARMALAGPATNFILMLSAAAAIRVGLATGYFEPPQSIENYASITLASDPAGVGSLVASFLGVMFSLNLILGVLNLIPVRPFDGFLGATILVSEDKARQFLDSLGQGQNIGMILVFVGFYFASSHILVFALNTLYVGITTYGFL